MKNHRLTILLAALLLLGASCKKDHYDMSHVSGVVADGELRLPLAHKSLTIMDLLDRFAVDSLIQWTESGNLFFGFHYDIEDAMVGSQLLSFDNMNYDMHQTFENPFPSSNIPAFDTVLRCSSTVAFDADHIRVFEAVLKSGHFAFSLRSNVGSLRRVVVQCPQLFDETGNVFRYDTELRDDNFGFDINSLRYVTDTANQMRFDYEVYFHVVDVPDPEYYVDVHLESRDVAFREMYGTVERYSTRSRTDTVFSLFPDNLSGTIELNRFRLRLRERNTFGMGACFVLDTALFFGEGEAPYAMIDPLPLTIPLPSQPVCQEVLNEMLNGKINAYGGRIVATNDFILNPEGLMEMQSVSDTSTIDVGVDLDIPFSFRTDDVFYSDTVTMDFSYFDSLDWIEKLTLEFTINSTLPINLNGSFYLFDSLSQQVTDTLFENAALVAASYDGKPVATNRSIEITEERLQKALHSNRVIMRLHLDTGMQEAVLNARQGVEVFIKGSASYHAIPKFD